MTSEVLDRATRLAQRIKVLESLLQLVRKYNQINLTLHGGSTFQHEMLSNKAAKAVAQILAEIWGEELQDCKEEFNKL